MKVIALVLKTVEHYLLRGSKMSDLKKIESTNSNGDKVTVFIKKPSVRDYRDSQAAYNKAFRAALDQGAILKQKLQDYMKEQGVWDDAKEKKYRDILAEISKREDILKAGGIPLKKAKDTALEMRGLRADFNSLIAERQAYENSSAEGQADNARFDQLIISCIVNEHGNRLWPTMEDYERDGDQPWANKAASELANDLYGLDPNYYDNLPENKFLVKYNFANRDLRLVNKDGHLIDSEGRLINENGRYVAYREDGTQYFVNVDGEEVDDKGEKIVQFSPFLDDDGNPVEDSQEPEPEKKTRKKKEIV